VREILSNRSRFSDSLNWVWSERLAPKEEKLVTTESMKKQLKELNREKEALNEGFPGMEVKQIVRLAQSVQSEFDNLIAEQIEIVLQERQLIRDAFPELSVAQVVLLAQKEIEREREEARLAADAEARSLAAQLSSLYKEVDELSHAFPGLAPSQVVNEVQEKMRLVEQLKAQRADSNSHLKAA
jgi:hypothetical protein